MRYLISLMFLFCADVAAAFETESIHLMLPNKNSYVQIMNSSRLHEVLPTGPTDFTVIDDMFAVLDSNRSGIVFLKTNGEFVKRIGLPAGYYERIIRSRDGSLLVFSGVGVNQTRIVRVDKNSLLEQRLIDATIGNLISHLIVDDLGLFIEISGELDYQRLLNTKNESVLKAATLMFKQIKHQRIKQDCFACKPIRSEGAKVNGLIYRVQFDNPHGGKPSLFIGHHKIELDHIHQNGGTHIEQIDADGTVWVKETVFLDDNYPTSFLWKIDGSGAFIAAYLLPRITASDYVRHNITISTDGKVYMMRGEPKGLLLDELNALSQEHMDNVMKKLKTAFKATINATYKVKTRDFFQTKCYSRNEIFITSLKYLYHYECVPDAAINNDDSCKGRILPTYLEGNQAGCYFSISYNWGGFDSVDSFSEKISYMKAGNINTHILPLLHCAAGVDCSGFVSQVWGLPSKWGTSEIYQRTLEVPEDEMQTGDVFVKPNSHVMMFITRLNDEISTYESTVQPGKVIASQHDKGWFKERGYFPRRAFNVCGEE